jgi:hypothetical protein
MTHKLCKGLYLCPAVNPSIGKYIMLAGALIVVVGLIVYLFGNKFGFLGRLPGDIRIERESGGFYFPIMTCILLSVVLTVVIRIVQWLMK